MVGCCVLGGNQTSPIPRPDASQLPIYAGGCGMISLIWMGHWWRVDASHRKLSRKLWVALCRHMRHQELVWQKTSWSMLKSLRLSDNANVMLCSLPINWCHWHVEIQVQSLGTVARRSWSQLARWVGRVMVWALVSKIQLRTMHLVDHWPLPMASFFVRLVPDKWDSRWSPGGRTPCRCCVVGCSKPAGGMSASLGQGLHGCQQTCWTMQGVGVCWWCSPGHWATGLPVWQPACGSRLVRGQP